MLYDPYFMVFSGAELKSSVHEARPKLSKKEKKTLWIFSKSSQCFITGAQSINFLEGFRPTGNLFSWRWSVPLSNPILSPTRRLTLVCLLSGAGNILSGWSADSCSTLTEIHWHSSWWRNWSRIGKPPNIHKRSLHLIIALLCPANFKAEFHLYSCPNANYSETPFFTALSTVISNILKIDTKGRIG